MLRFLIAAAAMVMTFATVPAKADEDYNATLKSIESVIVPIKKIPVLTLPVSEAEAKAWVQSIRTNKHYADAATVKLTEIRGVIQQKNDKYRADNPGLLGDKYGFDTVNRLSRAAESIRENISEVAPATAQQVKSDIETADRQLGYTLDAFKDNWGKLKDDDAYESAMKTIAEIKADYQSAVYVQEAFGQDAAPMKAKVTQMVALAERFDTERVAALEGSGLPDAASDDPEMMAAAEAALEDWGKGDEYGPIVLTSEAIKTGSRAETGLKSGGGTNAVLETAIFRWQGFVFWVPVRDGEDWFMHRMVARNYSQGNGVPTDRWRVWNEGKMHRILPSVWE